MRTIQFKSIPEYYRREKLGIKNNTVRKIDKDDIRFEILEEFELQVINNLEIEIINTDTQEKFTREVTDVCAFDGYYIISWRIS